MQKHIFLNWLKEKGLISIAGLYIRKLNLFGYNFLRFLVRAITNKKNADGTLFALIKNLLRL